MIKPLLPQKKKELLIWLREVKMYSIDDWLLEIAKTNMNLDIAKSYQKISPFMQNNLKLLVG